MKFGFAVAALAAVPGAQALLPAVVANGMQYYRNGRGSTLNITLTPTDGRSGSVSGTFATAVAASSCKQIEGVPQPVTGEYVDNSISWVASFADCGSTVTNSGNLLKDGDQINVEWILTGQAKDPEGADFQSQNIGFDSYKRVSLFGGKPAELEEKPASSLRLGN